MFALKRAIEVTEARGGFEPGVIAVEQDYFPVSDKKKAHFIDS